MIAVSVGVTMVQFYATATLSEPDAEMMGAVSAPEEDVPLSQEDKVARRWNRGTLLVVLIFVLVLGIVPLLAALVDLAG